MSGRAWDDAYRWVKKTCFSGIPEFKKEKSGSARNLQGFTELVHESAHAGDVSIY